MRGAITAALGAIVLASAGCQGTSGGTGDGVGGSFPVDAYKMYSAAAGWPAHPYVTQ